MKRWILISLGIVVAVVIWFFMFQPVIKARPFPKTLHGSRLLFTKADSYAQWEPFWTTKNEIIFITPNLQKLIPYDPHKAVFGSEHTINTITLGDFGVVVDGHELKSSLHNPIFNSFYKQLCKEYGFREAHCVPLHNQKVWVSQGIGQKYIFDSQNQKSELITGLPNEDFGITDEDTYFLSNGQILFLGTSIANNPQGTKAILYDPQSNSFRQLPHLAKRRSRVSFAKSKDYIFIIGGESDSSTTELYDPKNYRFLPGPSLQGDHGGYTSVISLSNSADFMVIGGDAYSHSNSAEGSCWIDRYDSNSNAFVSEGRMLAPRIRPSLLLLNDNNVMISGGWLGAGLWLDTRKNVYSIELFRP